MQGCKVEYQLRRIGKPSSLIGVKDVMKLGIEVTRFGRHSKNDFFLDSNVLKHFISRWHAEIHCVRTDEEVRYIIRDTSVNGVYVNHIRVKKNQILKEGDEVVFGHINGKNIQPGEFATQDESEFHFKFERIDENQPLDLTKDSFMIDVNVAEINSPLETPTRHKLGSRGTNAARRLLASPSNRSETVVLKDISKNGLQRGPGLVSFDDIIAASSVPSTALGPDLLEKGLLFPEAFSLDKMSDDEIFQPTPSDVYRHSDSSDPVITQPVAKEPLVSMVTSSSPNRDRLNLTIDSLAGKLSTKRKRKEISGGGGEKQSRKVKPKRSYRKYHTQDEMCSSFECLRPSDNTVNWVQCDKCDLWFHTTCVNCNYEQVAQEGTVFNCGCL